MTLSVLEGHSLLQVRYFVIVLRRAVPLHMQRFLFLILLWPFPFALSDREVLTDARRHTLKITDKTVLAECWHGRRQLRLLHSLMTYSNSLATTTPPVSCCCWVLSASTDVIRVDMTSTNSLTDHQSLRSGCYWQQYSSQRRLYTTSCRFRHTLTAMTLDFRNSVCILPCNFKRSIDVKTLQKEKFKNRWKRGKNI